jgi:hypothetical protein
MNEAISSNKCAEHTIKVHIKPVTMDTWGMPNGSKLTMPWNKVNDHVGNAKKYLEAHTSPRSLTDADALLVATGQLNGLLRLARPNLSGVFTLEDIQVLGTCIGAGPIGSSEIQYFPSIVLDNYGIEPEDYERTRLAPLIDKLLELTPLECLALADAIDQTCYFARDESLSLRERFAKLGIELLEEA